MIKNWAAQACMKDTCTVWDVLGTDQFGGVSYSAPYQIKCSYTEGGKLAMDDRGQEFMPNATIRTFDQRPKRDSLIILGKATGTPEGLAAYRIRKRRSSTDVLFANSIALLTG